MARGTLFSPRWLPWLTALIIAVITLTTYRWYVQQNDDYARARFMILTDDIALAITERMKNHELILNSGAGFIGASQTVSRREWHHYYESLHLDQNYPGILGFGYARLLRDAQRPEFERRIRDEGFPTFEVHPPGARALYVPVTYLEPFSGANLDAFGYDMFSNETRRQAMVRAVNQNATSMTSRVILVQKAASEREQAGVLIYVPVFYEGQPLLTRAQRWQALRGFVYSPYRISDLIEGSVPSSSSLGFILLDGPPSSATEMYRSFDEAQVDVDKARYTHELTLDHFGKTWTLRVYSLPGFEKQFVSLADHLLLPTGLAVALLAFALVFIMVNRQRKAERLAKRMTRTIRHNERELQDIRARQERVLSGSNDGWWEYDLQKGELFFSERWWSLLGLTHDDYPNTIDTFMSLLHPEDHEKTITRFYDRLGSNDTEFNFEFRLRHRDGHYIPFLSRGTIQRDGSGQAIRISGVNMDQSERHRVDQMKRSFVSTVSHELRTPLTSISGALSLVNAGALGPVPEPMAPMLDIAKLNSDRLTLLINDLLDMDKLIAGKMTFSLASYALRALIDEALKSNQGYADRFGVTLNARPFDDTCVQTDSLRFQQVLSNLLSNAIKFSPKGAAVDIDIHHDSEGVTVSVIDRGPGIPEAFKPHIFQQFSQADASDTRNVNGTGLGLAITRQLVINMRGEIGFETPPEGGTRFWVRVPKA
ncbi:CHASE domain-containing protein [Larsenimonas suaedae]|uniref:histidine kinase n=1 Tax=Larsenimonas suaedae TaxID=1851019 RepID=A0ABU1GRX3_9GAMM|nr:CHASE domain-containing protein [Larsenimonas suaedae]MCM2972439.1 CHASE domain-containing protein [Larsenimonas suaedae]MDR5894765.1 CHASE domain-containing protein [Larsenimonas suaedae]